MADEVKNETVQQEPVASTVKAGETSTTEVQPLVNLDTTGKSEIEQRIVARNMGKKVEPKRAEELAKKAETSTEPEKAKPVEEKVKTETPTGVITDEDIKDFPALKTLVGKPYSELTKVYANLAKEFGRSQTELAGLKKKPESTETKTTQKEEKTLDQRIDDFIESETSKKDFPDPIDDQKAYNKAMAKVLMKASEMRLAEMNKPITDQFEKQNQIEVARQQHDTTVSLVNTYLKDEKVDLDKLMGQFTESMQPVLAEHPDLYFGKPELLASDISRFYLSNKAKMVNDELITTKAELEAAKAGKQTTVAELKKKIEGAPDGSQKSGIVSKQKTLTPAQEIENKIVERLGRPDLKY